MQGSVAETRLERMRMVFAANLKKRMREKGLSQSDLARAIWNEVRVDSRGYEQPVNKDRISQWVNGRVLPNLENLQRLADALETMPEALLPDLETTILNHKNDPSRPGSAQEADFVFRIDGAYAFVQLKCRVSAGGRPGNPRRLHEAHNGNGTAR